MILPLRTAPASSLVITADTGNYQSLSFPLIATAAALFVGAAFAWTKARKKSLVSLADLESLLLTEEESSSSASDCIYLDYNGTTPIHPLVLAAMLPFLTIHFGNPSSAHYYGQAPKLAMDKAREHLLTLIAKQSEPPSSLWFTGCGTESDNLAIQLALLSNSDKKNRHIVTTNVEHPAIAECLKALEATNQVQVTYVPVQPDGRVVAQDVVDAIRGDTILVTVMLANNESGALQPVKEIAQACRNKGVLMHTDAAQACGKVDVAQLSGEADMITIVGHKIGAPKGIAALYVRHGCCHEHGRSLPDGGILLLGGGQEGGRRGGTENVAYMVGMGKAALLAVENLERNMQHMEAMRSRLLEKLQQQLEGVAPIRTNGPSSPKDRLPNTLSVGIASVQSGSLLHEIGNEVAASAGAACHSSGNDNISSILLAMKVPTEYARGTLRLSLGPNITVKEIDRAAAIIARQVKLQLQPASTD
jgi:cysteine desulfurase